MFQGIITSIKEGEFTVLVPSSDGSADEYTILDDMLPKDSNPEDCVEFTINNGLVTECIKLDEDEKKNLVQEISHLIYD